MKFIKSSIQNLRNFFDRNVAVSFITEPIISFDADAKIQLVKAYVQKHAFDFVGVRKNGEIVGYAVAENFANGLLGDYLEEFCSEEIIDENAPIVEAIVKMLEHSRLFVRSFGHVNGIVTRGDLQKAPVRMWFLALFLFWKCRC